METNPYLKVKTLELQVDFLKKQNIELRKALYPFRDKVDPELKKLILGDNK